MGKIAMLVLAAVFFLVMGVGDATAAEKAQPSRNASSSSRGAATAQPSPSVTSPSRGAATTQPSPNVTSPSRGAATTQPSPNVTSPSPGAGKAKLPKDVRSIPSGRVLDDLEKGNQSPGVVFDGRKPDPPPVKVDKSTSTLTPAEQAIKNYENSGRPGGGVIIRPAAPPPPPSVSPSRTPSP